jgi:hypothetical protein
MELETSLLLQMKRIMDKACTFKKLLDKGSQEDIEVVIKMINKLLN